MQKTFEIGFKNALIYQKLWPKQIMDRNYVHFLCILSLLQVENLVSRGSTVKGSTLRQNNLPSSENRDFFANRTSNGPVCKLKFFRWCPLKKKESALAVSGKVQKDLFPNSEIEIFNDFCRFSSKLLIFQTILRGWV